MNRFNQALLSDRFGFGAVESFDRSAQGVTSFGMGSGTSNGDLRFTHAGRLDNYSSFTIMFPPIDPASSFTATSITATPTASSTS